jgi:hypothetical protein
LVSIAIIKLYLNKAKYFGQLYVFHAWFPYLKYDKNEEKVWQKRMVPCAWFYMKRRRTKDYIQILDALVTSAKKLNFVIKPTHAMIDFEIATKKAYEQRFPGIIGKGCLFHFGQSLFKNL